MIWIIFFQLISATSKHVDYKNIRTDSVKTIHIQKPASLMAFMNDMGRMEGKSYRVQSPTGYLGKYQFHIKTLKSLGISTTRSQFLKDSNLQDSAMILYMKMNERELQPIINRFSHTYFNGIYITKAGILAGAHLVGSAGIWSYFYPDKFSYRTVDGNGVSVETYLQHFSKYDI